MADGSKKPLSKLSTNVSSAHIFRISGGMGEGGGGVGALEKTPWDSPSRWHIRVPAKSCRQELARWPPARACSGWVYPAHGGVGVKHLWEGGGGAFDSEWTTCQQLQANQGWVLTSKGGAGYACTQQPSERVDGQVGGCWEKGGGGEGIGACTSRRSRGILQ